MSTAAISTFKAILPPSVEKVGGGVLVAGGAAVSVLAAKSIIVLGVASQAFPLIGTIIGLVMIILGACIFYHAWQRENGAATAPQLSAPRSKPARIEMEELPRKRPHPRQIELNKAPDVQIKIDTPSAPEKEVEPLVELAETEAPIAEEASPDLALTTSDKFLTASNLLQWGLIGAGLCGVAPAVIGALGTAASVGSGIATYCMLPEDASLIRKAMTLPIIGKKLIEFNPIVNAVVQANSLYTLVSGSASKLSQVWKGLKTDPVNAVKAGAVHLFNLASGTAFAADSAGLINLRQSPVPEQETPSRPCDPELEKDCSGPHKWQAPPEPAEACNPKMGTDCSEPRIIKLATIYNNNGNAERQKISDLVTANHREIAKKWGLEHDVVTTDLVANKCLNPFDGKPANCSPYMNKIQYYRMQCADPAQRGKWVIYGDDDLIYSNPNINPFKAIDQLRNGKDTSVIMMREGADWATLFPIPGHKTHDPRIAVNSGFIMARIDDASCDLMERTWEHRNTKMPDGPNYQKCPTVAFCQNHGVTSLGDQTAMGIALQDDLSVMDRTVTIVLPRDKSAAHRAHIAFNTLHRDGCHQELDGTALTPAFDIGEYDRDHYPDGMWQPGDWNGQPAGYRIMGVPGLVDRQGRCISDRYQSMRTLQNMRLIKIKEMLAQRPKDLRFTVGMTFSADKNGPDAQYTHLTTPNHAEFARLNRAEFRVDTDPIQLQCTAPKTGKTEPCVPYFRKVEMIDRWLKEPSIPGAEEWFVYGDDDGLYGDMNLELSQLVKDLQGGTDASILIAKDIGQKYSAVNTGWMMFRKDDASRRFMKEWMEERNAVAVHARPNDPDCPTLGLCKNQNGSLHEQEGFGNILKRQPELLDTAVRVVDIRDPKLGYGVNTLVRHGCFSRNQPDVNWVRSDFDYTEDDLLDPSAKGARGDAFLQAAGVPRVGKFCGEPKNAPSHPIRKGYIEDMLRTKVIPAKYKPRYKLWG